MAKNIPIEHDPRYRRNWMFSRPFRKIFPWKVAQVTALLNSPEDWHGNQAAQNKFRELLGARRLIAPGTPRDPHSGGPRTYEALISSLGLIYSKDGKIRLTLAGDAVVRNKNPLRVLRLQLLRYQYPSHYGFRRQVAVHPQIKVKPFVFVLKLLQRPELGGFILTSELLVPIIYGHSIESLDLCIEKILKLRGGAKIAEIIDDPRSDLYTPATKGVALDGRIAECLSIANTCKNYLEACALIGTETVRGAEKIFISSEGLELFREEEPHFDDFVLNPDSEESFQRAFGRLDAKKDTRRDSESELKLDAEELLIRALFYEAASNKLGADIRENFVASMVGAYNFDGMKVVRIVAALTPDAFNMFEARFLELSLGGTRTARDFELAVCELFDEKLHFTSRHTGQIDRKGGRGEGNYADVFVRALDGAHCGIVDAKATARYTLPSADYLKMLNTYIPEYASLVEGEKLVLEFVNYVCGDISPHIAESLKAIEEKTGIPCSAIAARELLNLARKAPVASKQPVIRKIFAQSKVLKLEDFLEV